MHEVNFCSRSFLVLGISQEAIQIIGKEGSLPFLVSTDTWEKEIGPLPPKVGRRPLDGGGIVVATINLEKYQELLKEKRIIRF